MKKIIFKNSKVLVKILRIYTSTHIPDCVFALLSSPDYMSEFFCVHPNAFFV